MTEQLAPDIRQLLKDFQQDEITEYHIYGGLARTIRSPENSAILERIAADELRHSQYWGTLTGEEVKPNWLRVGFYRLIGRIFGFTFAIKLMERGEEGAQENYTRIAQAVPEATTILQEEEQHEALLIGMLDEERLRYTGSIILGLNDALVELTGALAGLTFALQNTQLIAMTGAITGIAAAFSMAASEYLSTKTEEGEREPVKAALYTGLAYIFTVLVLILPYLVLHNPYLSLGIALVATILIIGFFNYYISVARDLPFRQRFLEMAGLSLAVAAISFGVGVLLRTVFGVEV